MTRHRRFQSRDSSDESDYAEYALYDPGLTPMVSNQQPLTLIMAPEEDPYQPHHHGHRGSGAAGFLGMQGRNYMVLHASPGLDTSASGSMIGTGNPGQHCQKGTVSFTSLLKSAGEGNVLKKLSDLLLNLLSTSQRIIYFFFGLLTVFFFVPGLCTILFLTLCCLIIYGGYHNGTGTLTTRTIKWTLTGFSQQLKDGFMASPPFLDKSGQWRVVIKQKKGMDGIQTNFGMMCTDIFPEMESITATASFFCTNQLGQEVNTGGMRTLQSQHVYHCPGDCGFSRPVRLSRRQLGDYDVITVNCTVQFQKETVPFLKALVRNLRTNMDGEGEEGSTTKKGKNVVAEHGSVFPGDLEFHDEDPTLSSTFRPVFRFIQHSETRTFVWEIPAFTSFLESSELWGLYSPQFFVNSHDVCSMWRMKLLEVQGVFRLHVQLRGLPHSVKQLKLWYLLHLVDAQGASIIPEHAVSRVKYPDHMKLWETTRHILYRRETMLDRFLGEDGTLILRISLQIQPNDITLMEADSDNWINCPSMRSIGNVVEQPVAVGQLGRPLGRGNGSMQGSPMLAH